MTRWPRLARMTRWPRLARIALTASGRNWDIVGVVGKWDDGVAQKADAITVHGPFDGIAAQGGDTGVVQAMIDAGHPFVPFAGETETETETGLRKFCGAHEAEGPVCFCADAGPAQVAAAIKTSIDAQKGKAPPRSARLPLAIVQAPTFKDGENYSSAQSDNFCVGNVFPAGGINFTAQGNMRQDQKNQRRPTLDHRRRRKVAAAD
jgi:ribose transport system substrate-binding protein